MIAALGIAETNNPMPEKERAVVDPWLRTFVNNFEHGMRNDGHYKNYKRQDFGEASTLSWVAPYIARFPDHVNTVELLKIPASASYLAPRLKTAIATNGMSAEWIGIDARCFYAAID